MIITLEEESVLITNEKDCWFDWKKAIDLFQKSNIDLSQFEYTYCEEKEIYDVEIDDSGQFKHQKINTFYEFEFDCDVEFEYDDDQCFFCDFKKLSFQGIDFLQFVVGAPTDDEMWDKFENEIVDHLTKLEDKYND